MAERIESEGEVLDGFPPAGEEMRSEYVLVRNQFGTVDGVLRRASRTASQAVLIQTHPRRTSAMNLNAWPVRQHAQLRIDTFAFNNRATNSAAGTEVVTIWEELALDVAAAVQEMRSRGYRYVLLYGHSAGGPLMAYYQNLSENGNSIFNAGSGLSRFAGFEQDGHEIRFPTADALITQNSTVGTGYSFLLRLDGSVIDERSGDRDPKLDPFAEANGFDVDTGEAHYDHEFLTRYFAAQCFRMNRLVDAAQERLEACLAGRGLFRDDELIVVPGIRAEPSCVDLALAAGTREARRCLPSHEPVLVRSRRRVVHNYAARNKQFRDGGTVHTLRSFLSYRAVSAIAADYGPDATEPTECGIDFRSSNAITAAHVASVSVPLLITASTADTQVHLPSAELMYNAAVRTSDKSLVFIDGAEHDMTPVDEKFGDTRSIHVRAIAEWLAQRFGPSS